MTGSLGASKNHRAAGVLAHQLGERRKQLAAITGVDPIRAAPAEMVASRFRRHPDFLRRRMAVNDDAAPVRKFEFAHAFTPCFALAISPPFIPRPRNPRPYRFCPAADP